MKSRIPTTFVLVLAAALAACGGDAEEAAEGMVEETLEEIDDMTGADTLMTPAGPRQRVVVQAASFAYQPSEIRVAPGEIRFIVTNAADFAHGFEVEGHGMEVALEEIAPGTTDSLTATFEEPGEYLIYCPVGDHRERGMVGTLHVQAPAP
ncbi:MAG TPA: plastocyanin/azurin family copper-binding protein [Gemmatimonadota bacterium]|nr:plastocyanin/azurin family copper-binding protein [Gemmatimonadota bacterium]